jgi:uncharacterized protein
MHAPTQSQEEARLIQLLDEHHQWPCLYTFKFIVPANKGDELRALVPDSQGVEIRPSSGGRYSSYTFHCAMGSAREVLSVYAKVSGIEGLLSL